MKKIINIQLDSGLEFRPVSVLVQIANQYESSIILKDTKHRFNAKSIMGVMTLCTVVGDELDVVATGNDAEKAADHVARFLKYGEY